MEDGVPALSLGSEQQSSECSVQQASVDGAVRTVALLEHDDSHTKYTQEPLLTPRHEASDRSICFKITMRTASEFYFIYFCFSSWEKFRVARPATDVLLRCKRNSEASVIPARDFELPLYTEAEKNSSSDRYAAHFYAVCKKDSSSVSLCTPTGGKMTFSPVGWFTRNLPSLCRAQSVFIPQRYKGCNLKWDSVQFYGHDRSPNQLLTQQIVGLK